MSLVAAKILITPALMWAVSAAARRWGSLVGGLLSGLPLTSAPISIYLAVEQGEPFASDAAIGSVTGLGAVALAYSAYAFLAPRVSALGAVGAGLLAFVGGGCLLRSVIHPGLWPTAAIDLVLMALVVALCPASGQAASRARPPRWDMPARLVAATLLVVLVSTLAPTLGPALSGMLAPIPVISWPLIVFARLQNGVAASLDVVRGSVQGAFGVLAFYICLSLTLGQVNIFLAYTLSITLSVALVLPFLVFRR